MGDSRPYWKVTVSLAFSLAGTVLFLVAGYKLMIFFMPFVIGWVIAAIAAPLVNLLEQKLKIVRKLGSALIIIAVLAGIVFLVYFLASTLRKEVQTLIWDMPSMYQDLEAGFQEIGEGMQGLHKRLPKGIGEAFSGLLSNLDKQAGSIVGNISTPTVTAAGKFAKKIPSILVAIIVTFISAYFFIADRDEVLHFAKRITPEPIVRRMTMISDNLKYAVGGYFKAQFKIMAVVFLLLSAGFLIMGLNFTFLLAILIAFLDFLPFFGTGTALLPWAIYKFLVGNYKMAAGLLVLYGVTQLVRQLIQPKLVGDSIGLNPLLTLVFLYIGYKAGGIFGMIFAVPAGLIVINLYKAGAFDYILDDMRILAEGVLSLRENS
ncbi:sporulation integral membrane protein YtvI [Lachnospiraceae bacterium MD308]|nr:sporulation integral membrane protein YtvI [Lachnospiraceae bacterium MD308]